MGVNALPIGTAPPRGETVSSAGAAIATRCIFYEPSTVETYRAD